MGYLFLAIALAAGITKGYCGKRTSGGIREASDSMAVNVLRMALCAVIGLFLVLLTEGGGSLAVGNSTLALSALSGVASSLFVVTWLLSVRVGAYMMVEIFLLLGTVVPIALSFFFFDERITLLQAFGILLLLVAVYLMCTYNTGIKGRMKPISLLLLFLCGTSCGLADFSQKAFTKAGDGGSVAVFNFYTYLFAGAVLLATYLLFRRLDIKKGAELRPPMQVIKPLFPYVLLMAVCLFLSSFFKTKAAYYLDAARLYPLNQGAAVILSLLMSALLFKEKVNLRCIVGISLAFLALLLINMDFTALFA